MILEVIGHENSRRRALGCISKLTSVSADAKKVRVSELREIAPIAALGQINNIGSERARKFKKECSREQLQINERKRAQKTL